MGELLSGPRSFVCTCSLKTDNLFGKDTVILLDQFEEESFLHIGFCGATVL